MITWDSSCSRNSSKARQSIISRFFILYTKSFGKHIGQMLYFRVQNIVFLTTEVRRLRRVRNDRAFFVCLSTSRYPSELPWSKDLLRVEAYNGGGRGRRPFLKNVNCDIAESSISNINVVLLNLRRVIIWRSYLPLFQLDSRRGFWQEIHSF